MVLREFILSSSTLQFYANEIKILRKFCKNKHQIVGTSWIGRESVFIHKIEVRIIDIPLKDYKRKTAVFEYIKIPMMMMIE